LIPVYERTGRANIGHALETAVFIELQRRGFEVHYLRTPQGNEVDFHAIDASGAILLIQVCANVLDPATFQRETRSLLEAKMVHPEGQLLLLVLETISPDSFVPAPIICKPAIEWFLTSPV
jgi:predicted AAA+ superfamily ATPase